MKPKKQRKADARQKKPRKPGPGRASLYNKAYAAQAKVACAEAGFSAAKLGKLFGVGKQTVLDWRAKHAEFDSACREGLREFEITVVEASLYKRAKGYFAKDVFYGLPPSGDNPAPISIADDEEGGQAVAAKITEKSLVPVRIIKREVPPDVTAIKYFLGNKKPGDWKDKQTVEHDGAVNLLLAEEVRGMLQGIYEKSGQP